MNRVPDPEVYLEVAGGRVFDLPEYVIDKLATHVAARRCRPEVIQWAQYWVDQSAARRALWGES